MEMPFHVQVRMKLRLRRRNGRNHTALAFAPRAQGREAWLPWVIPWHALLPRGPNARRPLIKPYNCKTLRKVATSFGRTAPLDLGEAIDHAMIHWPDTSDIFGFDPRNVLLQDDISSDMFSTNLPARLTFARAPKVDPGPRALAAATDVVADAQEFRMCGEPGDLETPLGGYALRSMGTS